MPKNVTKTIHEPPHPLPPPPPRNFFLGSRRTETRELQLLDLTNLIEDKMILVNDPIFTREAVGHYGEKHQDNHGIEVCSTFLT